MCCSLCQYCQKVALPGLGGTGVLCILTEREVNPKDCNCNEFVPCCAVGSEEVSKKEVD